MPLNLDYFYGAESEQFSFYRIPKILFTNPRYKPVSLEAKVLYGLLLDRMSLSAKNGWTDDAGRVFIYFAQEDVQAHLCCGKNKVIALFKELESVGLIERKKQGQGKPAKVYVKNFVSEEPPAGRKRVSSSPKTGSAESPKQEAKTSCFETSATPKTKPQDLPKRDPNNTERKETDRSDTELSSPSPPPPVPAGQWPYRQRMRMEEIESYRKLIQENIDYDGLLADCPTDSDLIDGYVELMVEVVCSRKEFIRIGGEDIPSGVVKSRFLKLNREHIAYVRDCLCAATTAIGNIRAYTLAALYNAPVTMGQYYTSLASHDLAEGC